jgi:hypothetical protein
VGTIFLKKSTKGRVLQIEIRNWGGRRKVVDEFYKGKREDSG